MLLALMLAAAITDDNALKTNPQNISSAKLTWLAVACSHEMTCLALWEIKTSPTVRDFYIAQWAMKSFRYGLDVWLGLHCASRTEKSNLPPPPVSSSSSTELFFLFSCCYQFFFLTYWLYGALAPPVGLAYRDAIWKHLLTWLKINP